MHSIENINVLEASYISDLEPTKSISWTGTKTSARQVL